jgi:small GTP-binding protein
MKLSAHTKKFKKIKITVIGDTGIGKSNLISRLVSQTFTEEHKPTIFDSHTFLTKFGPWGVQLLIWEPSCTDKYTVKRPVCYPETGIFMICFDLSQPHSFHAAKQKWLEELQTHGYTNTPKIFVGLKQDVSLGFQEEIAYNQSYDNVTEEQYTICECSAKKDEGIDDVFEETIRKYIYYDQAKGDLGWRDVRVFASATTQKITNIFSMLN